MDASSWLLKGWHCVSLPLGAAAPPSADLICSKGGVLYDIRIGLHVCLHCRLYLGRPFDRWSVSLELLLLLVEGLFGPAWRLPEKKKILRLVCKNPIFRCSKTALA
jgi:hypothetical protein